MEQTTRTSKRKQKMHNEILSIAAELICQKGSLGVSLDEIAKHADVAEKTVYNHFDNKEALIEELVMPVCYHAMDYVESLKKHKNITLNHIWDYCLELWQTENLHARLLYQVNIEDYKDLSESRHGFIIVFMKILIRIPEYKSFSEEQLINYATIIYSTYIPLLESLEGIPHYEEIFKQGMTGLIEGVKQCQNQ